MAKPGLPKKKRGPSLHSRAARRATSPSIDTDKSLKEAAPPRERETVQPSVLAARQGAGVTKKTKRKAVASARARRKHDKGVGRAEAVSERTSSKVERSVRQAKAIKGRRKTWEEVNTALEGGGTRGKVGGGTNAFAALGEGEESEEDEGADGVEGEAPLRTVVPQMMYEGGVEEDEEIL